MAQNSLTQNVETAKEIIKEVKEAIIEKGIDIPEGTHAKTYPGYIAQMTSKTDFEELKEKVVLKGINESEVRISAPIIELKATEDSDSGLSLESGIITLSGQQLNASTDGDISLQTSEGNINLNPTTGQAQYKGAEIATKDDISTANYIHVSGGTMTGDLAVTNIIPAGDIQCIGDNDNRFFYGFFHVVYTSGGIKFGPDDYYMAISTNENKDIEIGNNSGNINLITSFKALYNNAEIATVDNINALPKHIALTQAEYDVLTPDNDTFYYIYED